MSSKYEDIKIKAQLKKSLLDPGNDPLLMHLHKRVTEKIRELTGMPEEGLEDDNDEEAQEEDQDATGSEKDKEKAESKEEESKEDFKKRRGDYKEYIRLLKFLTGLRRILRMSRRLFPMHHARWMGSCLQILKMFLCSNHFFMSAQQQADILLFIFYIVYVHFWSWFACEKLADAPFLTLTLHADLRD